MKTYMEKKETVKRDWYVIDATDLPLGRVCLLYKSPSPRD